jgi:hypothetical protein
MRNPAGSQRNINKWFNKTEQQRPKTRQNEDKQAKTAPCKIILNKVQSIA